MALKKSPLCSVCGQPKKFMGKRFYCVGECRKKYEQTRYLKDKNKLLEKVKKYRKTEEGKKSQKIAGQNRYKNHREKVLARVKVYDGLKKGKLKKEPCSVCGDSKVEAHHPDYSNPLSVVWLCQKHHQETTFGTINRL